MKTSSRFVFVFSILLFTFLSSEFLVPNLLQRILFENALMQPSEWSYFLRQTYVLMMLVLSVAWISAALIYGTKYFSAARLLTLPFILLTFLLFSRLCAYLISHYVNQTGVADHASARLYGDIFGNLFFFIYVSHLINVLVDKSRAAKPRTLSRLEVASLAVINVGIVVYCFSIRACGSFECRVQELNNILRSPIEHSVSRLVSDFVQSSPIIKNDLGVVAGVAVEEGQRVLMDQWQDYSITLPLEVRGAKGVGFLNLDIAGDTEGSAYVYEASWRFGTEITRLK